MKPWGKFVSLVIFPLVTKLTFSVVQNLDDKYSGYQLCPCKVFWLDTGTQKKLN